MSNADVCDLPDPETPVITVKVSRGISTLIDLRLCSRALRTSITSRPRPRRSPATACNGRPASSWTLGSLTRAVCPASAARYAASSRPVCERSIVITSSGEPAQRLRRRRRRRLPAPGLDQPVGGRDHVEIVFDDHQRMTCSQQLAEGAHQLGDVVEVPFVVGSSNRNSVPRVGALRQGRFSRKSLPSFSRCASPPDSVGTGWPSFSRTRAPRRPAASVRARPPHRRGRRRVPR